MFDYNCDITNEYNECFEMAQYMSTINIASGIFNSDMLFVKKAVDYALTREIALNVLIDVENVNAEDDELEANIIYQISAIKGYLDTFDLKLEGINFSSKFAQKFNKNIDFTKKVTKIIQKNDLWLNIYVQNPEFKEILEHDLSAKCVYEVIFDDKKSIREIREMEIKPESLRFTKIENAKRAYDVIKPTPIAYNRVCEVL